MWRRNVHASLNRLSIPDLLITSLHTLRREGRQAVTSALSFRVVHMATIFKISGFFKLNPDMHQEQ
jgi:hypothetical protein